MSIIKNIFIVLIVVVLLILIINNFLLRTNIIWDDIVQGQTDAGGLTHEQMSSIDSNLYPDNNIPFPSAMSLSSGARPSAGSIRHLARGVGHTGLIVPNSALPTTIGSNFMFSVWFFIDDFTANLTNSKYIASLMGLQNGNFTPTLITFLTPFNNNLGIAVVTQTSSNNPILNFYYIENIPLQRWNCLIISIVDRTMDVYLDGKLVNSFILAGFYTPVPDTSLYIGNNRNQYFNGFITRARFDNGGVNPQQAYSIYREGINTSFAGNFLDRYRIKVGLYEYNDRIGGFQI